MTCLADASCYFGLPVIATTVVERETLVVEAQQMQDRGVPVVDVDGFLNRFVAELIGRSVRQPAPYTTARHPDGEALVVVVATGSALYIRRSSELAGPDDECVFQ